MRLLAIALSASVLSGAGAGAAAGAATGPPPPSSPGPLTAVQVDDHRPAAWHFEHRGHRLVVVP